MLLDISCLPKNRILSIDMKNFYANCECVDHVLDPLEGYVVVVSFSRQIRKNVLIQIINQQPIFCTN